MTSHTSMSGLGETSPLLRFIEETPDDTSYKTSTKKLLASSLPIFFVYFTSLARDNICLHFLKRFGDNRLLNAVGIGSTYIDVFAAAMFISLNIGLTSKASKAFAVANYPLVGIYSHRSYIVNTFVLIPGSILAYFADLVCIAIGYDRQTSLYVQQYLSLSIPGLFAFMIFNTQIATLYACQKFYVPALIEIVGSLLYWGLSYLLIEIWNMTIVGVAICFNAMYFVSAIMILLYQKFWDPVPGSFFWFNRRSFTNLWGHLKMEVLVGSTVFLEWIANEIVFMFAGVLAINEITALTIANNNLYVLDSIPLALMDALVSYMSSAMGENHPKKAKRFLLSGLIISSFGLVIIEGIFLTFPRVITSFYNDDPATVNLAADLLRISLLGYISQFAKDILMAGLTAIGKERVATKISLICYYLIEIPMSYALCFFAGLNSTGLALGQAITPYILLIAAVIVYWRLDWKEQAHQIVDELGRENLNYSFILDAPDVKDTFLPAHELRDEDGAFR